MAERFPFFSKQSLYDAQAACAAAMAIAAMGPAFQLLRWGSDEAGFLIEGAASEAPSRLWLEELERQILKLWAEPWHGPETMMGSNLREFWRYRGQRVRARDALPPLVEVLSVSGERDLKPNLWSGPLDPPYGIFWFEVEPLHERPAVAKGHNESCWRLQGRVLLERQAKRLARHLAPIPHWDRSPLSRVELERGFALERLWQQELADVALYGARPGQLPTACGWWWHQPWSRPALRPQRLLNEPQGRSLVCCDEGSLESLSQALSSGLRRIQKVVKILGLEVEQRLGVPASSNSNQWRELVEGVWKMPAHQIEAPQWGWDLWAYDAVGIWWPIAQWKLSPLNSLWRLEAEAVIDWDRLVALSLQSQTSSRPQA